MMIEKGADLNLSNALGETPLHVSSFLGNFDVSTVLLDHFADPNSLTRFFFYFLFQTFFY